MCVLTIVIFDSWSKYIIVLEYAAIYEHEIVEKMHINKSKTKFDLRVMNVSFFHKRHYIKFLKKSNELNVLEL